MINIIVLNLVYQLIKLGHKKEQRKLLEVLCLQGLYGEPRARTQEEKSGELRPDLRERERERVQNYLELPNNLLTFFQLSYSCSSMN